MEELKLSQISLPITLKIEEIETAINDQIDGVLYENSNLNDDSNDDFEIRAEKPENISVTFDSSHIDYRVPLKVWIKKMIPITKLEVEVEGAIALSLSTEYKIENEWKLTTQTHLIEHEWLQKPQLKMGLFNLPIKFILNTVLEKSRTLLCNAIDKELAKNFDLQSIVKEAWKQIQAPIQLDDQFGIWLRVMPEKVGMTPLMSDGEHIKSTITVQTYAEAVIGEKPKPSKEEPVPPFLLSTEIKDGFDLHLKTFIDYSEAEKIAHKIIVGQTIPISLFTIKIIDLKLSGKGEKVVIETKFSGSFSGNILFEGIPEFDQKIDRIKIKQPDYKLITKNILLRFINWISKGIIINRLKKLLNFPVKENMDIVVQKIGKLLENYEVADEVILTGNLSNLDITNIQFEEKGLNLSISSMGKLSLHINKIEIKKEPENHNL